MPDAPAIVPLGMRLLLVLGLTTLNTGLYMVSNAHPQRAPTALQPTAMDLALGWHAWTIWPYWLLLALAPILAIGLREQRILANTLRAYAWALGMNLSIWILWPTRIAQRVIPDTLDSLTASAWGVLYLLDGPHNCFPSGHVTIPLVVAAGFCTQYPQARRWLWLLLAILLPSVISTGQHYAWDVLGGAATAGLGLWLAGHGAGRAR